MPEMELIDPTELAQEFVLIADLLHNSTPEQPVWRWLEYQAYSGFTRYVVEKGELPQGFDLFAPDSNSVRAWIAGHVVLPKSFIKELGRLLLALQAAGSGIIDDLCRFYCAYKAALNFAADATTTALYVASIKAILIAYAGDVLFVGGVPMTAFAAILIRSRLLDKICKCP